MGTSCKKSAELTTIHDDDALVRLRRDTLFHRARVEHAVESAGRGCPVIVGGLALGVCRAGRVTGFRGGGSGWGADLRPCRSRGHLELPLKAGNAVWKWEKIQDAFLICVRR